MTCEKCGATTHRDDAMNRRCNSCEYKVHQCICKGENTMIQQVVTVGDKVSYHGSQQDWHGEYTVAFVPEHVEGRGYILHDPDNLHPGLRDHALSNVHRDSFTLISTG